MGIFEDLFGEAENDNEKLLRKAASLYGMSTFADTALDAAWTTEDERLDTENKQLDAYLKRRSLGLPMDTQDLNDAMNDEMSFKSKGALAMFGRKGMQMIPDPSFLKPKLSGNLSSTFKFGTKVGELDDWPSVARGVLGVLTKRRA